MLINFEFIKIYKILTRSNKVKIFMNEILSTLPFLSGFQIGTIQVVLKLHTTLQN